MNTHSENLKCTSGFENEKPLKSYFLFSIHSITYLFFTVFIHLVAQIQRGSKIQTSPVFEWLVSAGTGHLITRPFDYWTE